MPEPRPAEDRSQPASSLENVLYLTAPAAPAPASTVHPTQPSLPLSPFHTDGGATIKTGGMPAAAWQSNAAELAKLLVGRQLGSFQIEASLGTGGMAAVFQASDPLLNRQVALKVLPPLLAAQVEHVQRFEREAKVAAQLDHDNVARVHFYGQDQGLHFIAYEFVDGINLRDLMTQHGGKLPVAMATDYLMQAAQGLAHTAARGVIHRDIKPSNLVITTQGRLKLVDLGLARNSMEETGEALTHAGATLGTFDYLSPEQAIDPRLADVRSDIYSLGCTFYHALTGVPPVPEGTAARKLQSHQQEMPRHPTELNHEIPQTVVNVLSKMLAKRAEDRYQNAEELIQDLRAFTTSRNDREIVPAQSVPLPITNSMPWYATLLGILCLVGGIVVWDLFLHEDVSGTEASILKQHAEKPPVSTEPVRVSPVVAEKNSLPVTLEIDTVDELLAALKRPTGGTLILKHPLYEIRGISNLVISAGEWIIRSAPGQRSTLRLMDAAASAMIEIKAGTLRLQQLQLEVHGLETTALMVQPSAQLMIDQCEFVREGGSTSFANSGSGPAPFMNIHGTAEASPVTTVEIRGSVWHPSAGVGVVLDGPGYIHIDECWIAPQHQFIVMPALTALNAKRMVSIRQSAVVLSTDACFKVAGRSPIYLEIERSIFSKLNSGMVDDSTWIAMDEKTPIDLQSYDSIYHRIHSFASIQSNTAAREVVVARDWRQLRQTLTRCKEEGTVQLSRYPWQETKPWQRFVESHKPASLALKAEFAKSGPSNLLGKLINIAGSDIAGVSSTVPSKTGRVLIVDGHGDEPGTFSTLNSALGSIADEEETTIQLQVHGTLPVKTAEVGNSKVLIKASDGYRPELVFHRDTVAGPDGEAHLFRVHDGELALENVRVRLEPLRDSAKSLSMAFVTGTGKCRVKDTIITLKGTNELQATVYSVGDPTGILSPGNNKTARVGSARLECADSLIRGFGQVLNVQTSRPFTLQASQTGMVLDGTLFTMEGNRGDMAMPSDSATLQLDRCTCFGSRGLLFVRSTNAMPQLLPLRCIVNQTILATGEQQPMVRLDVQQADSDLKRKLFWQGKRNIYLSPNSTLMSYHLLDRDTMATLYDATLWSEYWGSEDEQSQVIKTLTALQGLARQTPFADWEANDFTMRYENGNALGMRDMGLPLVAMPRMPESK